MIEFKTGVIRPLECFKEGWALIKDQYWLIFGVTAVGMLIGNIVPFGILIGAMFCGIYYTIFRLMKGEKPEFADLFKGFNYFKPGLIATLIFIIPIFIFTLISWGSMVGVMATMFDPRGGFEPKAIFTLYGVLFGEGIIFGIILSCIHAFIMFTYPLIVEHNLSGIEAFKLSSKAAWNNLGGVVGLILWEFIMGLIGSLVCGIGGYFVLPIMFAGVLAAYRKVFPSNDPTNFNPPRPDVYPNAGENVSGL